MSETFLIVEAITCVARRLTTEQKLSVVKETLLPGVWISHFARRAVRADEDVVAASPGAAPEMPNSRPISGAWSMAYQ
jgi:hypothetical protein